jgi:hypothetical protein
MTAGDARIRSTKVVVFNEAEHQDEHIVAVLIQKNDAGAMTAIVKEFPGRHAPDPEAVALLKQAAELANL